jgi:hypothetical protein
MELGLRRDDEMRRLSVPRRHPPNQPGSASRSAAAYDNEIRPDDIVTDISLNPNDVSAQLAVVDVQLVSIGWACFFLMAGALLCTGAVRLRMS